MEVLIALAIFSIGLMAMGSLQSRSLMSTNRSTDLTEAWTVLEDWVGMLNTIPFYPNDNNMNDDGDGATDETDEIHPWLEDTDTSAAGFDHQVSDFVGDTIGDSDFSDLKLPQDGRYEVHWRVVNDEPISQKDETELPGVSAGSYTVSKTITVSVTRPNGDPQADALAMAEFVKVWGADEGGIP